MILLALEGPILLLIGCLWAAGRPLSRLVEFALRHRLGHRLELALGHAMSGLAVALVGAGVAVSLLAVWPRRRKDGPPCTCSTPPPAAGPPRRP
jgi:hypothetical protein